MRRDEGPSQISSDFDGKSELSSLLPPQKNLNCVRAARAAAGGAPPLARDGQTGRFVCDLLAFWAVGMRRFDRKFGADLVREFRPAQFGGRRECADDDVLAATTRIDELARKRTVATSKPVASHRITDSSRHDEAEAHRVAGVTRHAVVDGVGRGGSATAADDVTEVHRVDHPIRPREHERTRRRARCGPCDDVPRGSRDPHACACGDGSRAPWHDAGCSAGRFASTW